MNQVRKQDFVKGGVEPKDKNFCLKNASIG